MVVVAVTSLITRSSYFLATLVLLWSNVTHGAILPDERADLMYHRYDGGGVVVDGPSLLVRKNFKETVSISGNYYVDNVSSASIDVLASGASAYSEERTEYSLSADYLYNKSVLSLGYTNSDEDDYQAESYYFDISQDFFGDLTTITFGYSLAKDEVFQNGNEEFSETVDRNNFRLDLSQVISPNMVMGINYELITDEGYLNNPYRSYRFQSEPLDANAGYQFAREVYPNTRTSDAAAIRAKYYLPWRATVGASYRYFTDDWGINAHSLQLSYTHVLNDRWFFDVKYRYYVQSQADFYNDLFLTASQDEKDYRARDKELSDFNDHTFSAYLSYEYPFSNNTVVDKAAFTLQWDHIWFSYDNFRDITDKEAAVGEEPLYDFDADVIKVIFTLWY